MLRKDITPYNNHGRGCNCSTCIPSKTFGKCGMDFGSGRGASADSPYQKDIALAVANGMHHEGEASKHNEIMWQSRREGQQPGRTPIAPEKMAEHITAATHHNRAAEHFRQASRAFAEDRPKAAKEHLDFANNFAEKAKKASEKAFKKD